ncbi:MAG: hypothetical protein AAF392_00275, partial [Bacteroidota bacterium]
EGIICHMPSEEAVYFWKQDGKCWRFTISPAGGLTSESIADLNIGSYEGRFIFAAGSKEKQVLYAGEVDNWRGISLRKYASGRWQPVPLALAKSKVYEFFPDCSNAQKPTACTLEVGSQLCGCLMLQLFVPRSFSYSYAKVSLVFDPTTQNFRALQPMLSSKAGNKFVTAVRRASGTILVGERQHTSSPASFSALSISNDSLAITSQQITNRVAADRWESFLLRAAGEFPTSEPILATHKKDTMPSFHKLDEHGQVISTGSLSIASVGNSLVLPFSNVVYVVTTIQEDRAKKLVTYRGELQLPTKGSSKKL